MSEIALVSRTDYTFLMPASEYNVRTSSVV
jgi:hypothetical protein